MQPILVETPRTQVRPQSGPGSLVMTGGPLSALLLFFSGSLGCSVLRPPLPWTPSSPLFPMGMSFFPVALQVLVPHHILLLLLDVSHPDCFLLHDNKVPDITHLKKESFILAYRIRDFIP